MQAVRCGKKEIGKIKKYCEQDVKKVTKEDGVRAGAGHVGNKDGYRKREIPIDTSSWPEKEDFFYDALASF
ncbi:MAG: hypothetical protein R3B69_02280 [Candidatus Paceibacterota bacterium]